MPQAGGQDRVGVDALIGRLVAVDEQRLEEQEAPSRAGALEARRRPLERGTTQLVAGRLQAPGDPGQLRAAGGVGDRLPKPGQPLGVEAMAAGPDAEELRVEPSEEAAHGPAALALPEPEVEAVLVGTGITAEAGVAVDAEDRAQHPGLGPDSRGERWASNQSLRLLTRSSRRNWMVSGGKPPNAVIGILPVRCHRHGHLPRAGRRGGPPEHGPPVRRRHTSTMAIRKRTCQGGASWQARTFPPP